MKKSLRIVFFGNERIATGIDLEPLALKSLLDSHHDVLGLVVHLSNGNGRKVRHEPIVDLAEAHRIPVFNPTHVKDIAHDMAILKPDIGVLIAYGKIIPENIISLFPMGILNLHPSLLPLLRGSTPIETAILEGHSQSGVSIISLVGEMDAGPIFAQQSIDLQPLVSKIDLATSLQAKGTELLLKVLDNYKASDAQEQKHSQATYTKRLQKNDGLIDWSKTADRIEREIRAYNGWPKSSCTLFGIECTIVEGSVDSGWGSDVGKIQVGFSSKNLRIQCKNSSLSITKIQPAGKSVMAIAEFLNGYRTKILSEEDVEIRD